MTRDVVTRRTPARPVRRGPSPGAVAVSVLRASLRSVALGLVAVEALVVLAWALDGRSGAGSGEALRAGALVWLVSHGARVAVAGGSYGLMPLTLTLLLLWLPLRAGAGVVRELQPRPLGVAASLGAAVGVPYAVAAALLTAAARTAEARPAPVRALLVAGSLTAVAGAVGGVRARGWDPREVPERARLVGTAAAAALGTLAAGGAAAMATALVWHFGRATSLVEALKPGIPGAVVLLLLCAAYAANAVVWCVAFGAGTGFAIGTGTAVAPTGISLGPMPAFPLLAALPGAGPVPRPALLTLLVPVAAGAVAGAFVTRLDPALSSARAAGWAALTGPVAGLAVAVACVLASGPAGPGRLSQAGPGAALTGLAVAEWVALVGAATAALLARRRRG